MMAQPIIGIVGLGTMGLGIAQVYAQAGFRVVATDGLQSARESALPRLNALLTERVNAGKLAAEQRDAMLARIGIVDDVRGMAEVQMVIEAIIENIDAKRELIAKLENVTAPDTVLATNTSSLSVAAIAKGMALPQRFLGLHFFNPAPVMKLVELVACDATGTAALANAREFTEHAGKTVIACSDRPGFIVNRCARPFYGEALALLEEGRSASDIDAAMMTAGYRLGPFGLIDLIGADINLAATRGLFEAMDQHPRYHVFDALIAQVAKGNLGRKSGRGFVFPQTVGTPPADAASIVLRLEAVLANEAATLLAEGGVDAAGIETAMKLGLNFPRGPFEAARLHGKSKVLATLAALEAKAPPHLKGRYAISPALETTL
jgi:3-hydroxybutyryl-CoA dehydrogenase